MDSSLPRSGRRSLRMPGFDYRLGGPYFVTICTKGRRHLFGSVESGILSLNPIGRVVDEEWQSLPATFPGVLLDEHVVMPNHFHGILRLGDGDSLEGVAPHSLGDVLQAFKSRTTIRIHSLQPGPGAPVWQRGYYDRIIRDVRALEAIQAYIRANPENWEKDPENLDSGR